MADISETHIEKVVLCIHSGITIEELVSYLEDMRDDLHIGDMQYLTFYVNEKEEE